MTDKIWTEEGYTTPEEIEKKILQLYSYNNKHEKVGWYYCPGPLHGSHYKWSISRRDKWFALKQIKVYKACTTNKNIVLINGTVNLYYNLGKYIDLQEERYRSLDPKCPCYKFNHLPLRIEYYRETCDIFRHELTQPYVSCDAIGFTSTTVAGTHSCHNCGNQTRKGKTLSLHCKNCRELMDPYGILLVHEDRLVNSLLDIIGDCAETLPFDSFVQLILPILNRENEW